MKLFIFISLFFYVSASFGDSTMLYMQPSQDKKVRPPDLYVIRDFKRPGNRRLIETEVDGQYIVTKHFIAFVKSGKLFVITDFDQLLKRDVSDNVVNIFKGPDSELIFEVINTVPVYKRELYYISDFVDLKKNLINTGFVGYSFQF